jgi:hypothetical protein
LDVKSKRANIVHAFSKYDEKYLEDKFKIQAVGFGAPKGMLREDWEGAIPRAPAHTRISTIHSRVVASRLDKPTSPCYYIEI